MDAAAPSGTMSDMWYVDERIEVRRHPTFGKKQPITLKSFFAGLGADIQSHWTARKRARRNPTVALYPNGDLLWLKGGTPYLEPYFLRKVWEDGE